MSIHTRLLFRALIIILRMLRVVMPGFAADAKRRKMPRKQALIPAKSF